MPLCKKCRSQAEVRDCKCDRCGKTMPEDVGIIVRKKGFFERLIHG